LELQEAKRAGFSVDVNQGDLTRNSLELGMIYSCWGPGLKEGTETKVCS